MRLTALLTLGGAGALWLLALTHGFPGLPVELVLRPSVLGPPGVPEAPLPPPPPPPPPPPAASVLRVTVTRTVAGVESFAVGDAVLFDRYGVVAPRAGVVHCVPLVPGAPLPVQVTPLGGRLVATPPVSLERVGAGAAGCEPGT